MNNHIVFIRSSCFVILLVSFIGCYDKVEVKLDEAPPLFVVDAWLNNLPEEQTIKLTYTQPYFENRSAIGVESAYVMLENRTRRMEMVFNNRGNGEFTYTPVNGEVLGLVGDKFLLNITYNDQIFLAASEIRPVPKIDSIIQSNRTNQALLPNGIYAQFFARDLPGIGDTYWIKTFKNGIYLNKPEELNIAFDAGVDFGASLDGVTFVSVIRELVNSVPEGNTLTNDMLEPPYQKGDSIYVEIHSITNEAFQFLKIGRNQLLNGNNAIFSVPFSNTQGNVYNTQTNDFAIGMFCVSAVEGMGRKIK